MLPFQMSDFPLISDSSFRLCRNADEQQRALFVRGVVFCAEQGIAYPMEYDGLDSEALQILGEVADEPVAAGRIRFSAACAKLERIAVRAPWRGRRIGHQLTDFMIRVAEAEGFAVQKIHAQKHLERFYGLHGFHSQGESFEEAGIEHIMMLRVSPSV